MLTQIMYALTLGDLNFEARGLIPANLETNDNSNVLILSTFHPAYFFGQWSPGAGQPVGGGPAAHEEAHQTRRRIEAQTVRHNGVNRASL
jgi:hypothetical protein